jgi:hypothetical protein
MSLLDAFRLQTARRCVYSRSLAVEPFYKLDGLEDKVSDAILISLL